MAGAPPSVWAGTSMQLRCSRRVLPGTPGAFSQPHRSNLRILISAAEERATGERKMSIPSRRVLANRNAASSLALPALPALPQEGVTPKGSALTRGQSPICVLLDNGCE